ncbi:MAG: tetratricopeptide repeat protein [Gemmatimonadales bacterium]
MPTASDRRRSAMISSTALDLPLHRQAVIDACNRAKLSPIAMEHLPARDADAVRVSLEMVDEADVYVGIFAFRYGHVPAGHEVSITELELDRAVARRIPILIFLAHDDHLFTRDMIEADAVAQDKLRRLKERAARGRVIAMYRSVEDLGAKAFQALAEWRLGGGQEPPDPTGSVVPHELEPAPIDFVGREDEVAKLIAAIGDRHRAVLVHGMAGVGKTCLASAAGNRIADRYPDGQIVIDMRGADEQPRDPVDAITRVLGLLVAHRQSAARDLESLRKDYLSALFGKRVLLLLDNAASAEQVEPLVPPAGCLLLVTSRRAFHVPGGARLELSTLTDLAAVDFITAVVPAAAPVAGEVARLCGRLPLALRLAVRAMIERPDLPPAAYLERLLDEGRRRQELAPVFHSIGLSVALLEPEAAAGLLELAVFPDDFDRAAATAIWEIAEAAADQRIGQLVGFGLLVWSPRTERYSLHDLVRELALDRLDPERARAAKRRHASHFERVLAEAEALYLSDGEAQRRGIALATRERSNIAAGIAWAMGNDATDAEAVRLCCRYPETGIRVMNAMGWTDQRLWAKCRDVARRVGDRRALCVALRRLETGSLEQRLERVRESLEISREIGDRECEGSAQQVLADTLIDLGRPEDARRAAEESLAIARATNDRRLEAFAIRSLGSAFEALGKPDRVLECFERRRQIARQLGDRYSEAVNLAYLFDALEHQGRVGEAIERALEAADIYPDLGLQQREFNRLIKACVCLREKAGRAADALALTERIDGIAPALPQGIQNGAVQKALCLLELRRHEAAAQVFEACAERAAGTPREGAFWRCALVCRADGGDRDGAGRVMGRLEALGGGWTAGGEALHTILGDFSMDRGSSLAGRLERLFADPASAELEGGVLDALVPAVSCAATALVALAAPRRALALRRLAAKLATRSGAERLGQSQPTSIAILHVQLGELEPARELFAAGLDQAAREGDWPTEAQSKCNLADVLLRLGRTDEAITLLRETMAQLAGDRNGARRAIRGAGRAYLLALCRANLGAALSSRPETMAEAAELVTTAIETFRRAKHRDHEPEILCTLARIALHEGDPARAIELCSSAVAVAVEASSPLQEADSRWALGKAHLAGGDLDAACAQLSQVVEYERRIEHRQADEHAAYVASLRSDPSSQGNTRTP